MMESNFTAETGAARGAWWSGKPAQRILIPDAIVLVCLVLGAGVSVLRGQDANWDLRNYHLYNGWAALHGRLGIDLAAAGLQSWINPVLDIPYSWLALGPLSNHPRLLAAFMGLWYGALIAIVLGIAVQFYKPWPSARRWPAIVAATILACTGAAVFSQAGMTFNEIQTGALTLSSLLLMLREIDAKGDVPRTSVLLSGGALLGVAAGLKITSAIYAPAAAVALIAVLRIRRWPFSLSLLALGGIAGFAVGGGWWAYKLYQAYSNPVFPFFNSIFQSPWYPPANIFDRRFLPRDIFQTLFYPFFWLSGKPMLVTERGFHDGRLPTVFVLAVTALLLVWLRAVRKKQTPLPSITLPQRFLLAFAICSYLLWLGTTSILRYAIPVEVSAVLLIPFLIGLILDPESGPDRTRTWINRAWIICVATVSLVLLGATRYPPSKHIPYGRRVAYADMSWLQPNSLVILLGPTVSYIIPFEAREQAAQFIGISDAVTEARGFGLADEAIARIGAHRGPIFIVHSAKENWRLPLLTDMGVVEQPDSCRTFFGSYDSALGQQLSVCAGKAQITAALHDPFWLHAAERYEEIAVPRLTPNWSYAAFVRAVGNAAHGKRYVDPFDIIWSRQPGRPKEFDDRILPHTLYILDPTLAPRALRAMDRSRDLLARFDGVLVLAPGWLAASHAPDRTQNMGR